MTKNELNNRYFHWMYQLVYERHYTKGDSYIRLFNHLHRVPFQFSIGMDGNRAEDGIALRYRFGYEQTYPDPMIACYLDDKQCSVLEMMVALAHRCEEEIMYDPDAGDRTGEWFWEMIHSLGLMGMTDDLYSEKYVNDVLYRFMDHDYAPNGKGGLFTVEYPERDMRSMEIWRQMFAYLNELY